MTPEILLLLGLLIAVIVLFATEALSIDVVTLLLLLVLMGTGILTPSEAFAGFSSEVIVALASVFVITGALQESGVIDDVVRRITRFAPGTLRGILRLLLPLAAGLSAFMNNTTVAAVLVSPVSSLAREAKVAASRLLMPMAYATILGGTCTLVGTSTNVAVSGYMASHGIGGAGMFEMTLAGLALALVGAIYLLVVSPWLLPEHENDDLSSAYPMRDYLSEIVITENSPLVGTTLLESDLARQGFRVLRILRDTKDIAPKPQTTMLAGDVVLVEGNIEDLMRAKERSGIEIHPQLKSFAHPLDPKNTLTGEAIVLPHSELLDETLKSSKFRQRFGLIAIALSRAGRSLRAELSRVRLKVGDVLLVQGDKAAFDALKDDPNLAVLQRNVPRQSAARLGWLVLGVFALAVTVNALGWMPLAFCFLSAAVIALLVKAITAERAYEVIEWRLLILIAGMTAFGTAMEKTGAARVMCEWLLSLLQPLGPHSVMLGLAVLTVILTQPMSNAAAALVMMPVALEVAATMELNPRMLSFVIMLSASVSLITPLEPACVLVYSPGRYRFMDFVRCGAPLTILLVFVIIWICPLIYGLHR